jgi:hypothetical protein
VDELCDTPMCPPVHRYSRNFLPNNLVYETMAGSDSIHACKLSTTSHKRKEGKSRVKLNIRITFCQEEFIVIVDILGSSMRVCQDPACLGELLPQVMQHPLQCLPVLCQYK